MKQKRQNVSPGVNSRTLKKRATSFKALSNSSDGIRYSGIKKLAYTFSSRFMETGEFTKQRIKTWAFFYVFMHMQRPHYLLPTQLTLKGLKLLPFPALWRILPIIIYHVEVDQVFLGANSSILRICVFVSGPGLLLRCPFCLRSPTESLRLSWLFASLLANLSLQ